MKGKNNSLILIIVAVVVGAAGFFGGMQYQKAQAASGPEGFAQNGNQRFMQRGQGSMQGGPNGQGNRPVSGEIISQDDTSITVKMEDGSTKIVILADDTTINKSSTGTKADLKTGEKVTAYGSTNSDGSITAQMVSLGATMFRFGPGGGASGGNMQRGGPPSQNN